MYAMNTTRSLRMRVAELEDYLFYLENTDDCTEEHADQIHHTHKELAELEGELAARQERVDERRDFYFRNPTLGA
jgi:hypothetical protein